MTRSVFVTGGTGYIGSRLITELLVRGHEVRALVREASLPRLTGGCIPIIGDALDGSSFTSRIPPADTFVHLVGTPNPSPSQKEKFRTIDLASAREAIASAHTHGVDHFIYVSVAHPAPIMQQGTRNKE